MTEAYTAHDAVQLLKPIFRQLTGVNMESENIFHYVCRSEQLIRDLASRHGFRSKDYSLVWDDGKFQSSRDVHALEIIAADGRRSAAEIPHLALVEENPWQYFGKVDAALMDLARRGSARGR